MPSRRICKAAALFKSFLWLTTKDSKPLIANLTLFIVRFPSQGGIISKLRRRLTVQGESETIDGVLPSRPVLGKQESDKLEDVSLHRLSTSNHSHLIFLDRLSFAYESLVFRFYDLMASITSIFAAQ